MDGKRSRDDIAGIQLAAEKMKELPPSYRQRTRAQPDPDPADEHPQ
ncbi:hypothetical protein [Mycobacterium persicum]|nr:hypothetical protein [Mycobacterium persicum]